MDYQEAIETVEAIIARHCEWILKNKGVLPEGDETALKQINAINDAFNKIRNG